MANFNSAMATMINLLRLLAVSFICCCTVTVSQTIAIASTSNATHTVYDTSQGYEFGGSSFYCNTSYCIIICDTYWGCRDAEVVIDNSISANIVCSGHESCYRSALQITNTDKVEIDCIESGHSCKQMEMAINKSRTANIMCSSDFSCSGMEALIFDTETVEINCTDCDNTDITIDNSTSTNILCSASSSCSGMVAFIFDTETVTISCTKTLACSSADITVNNSNSFTMFCGDSFCSTASTIHIVANEAEINALAPQAAHGMEIRAQWVQSRFVLRCDFEGSCDTYTKVWCPTHEDSLCTIECTKDGACSSVYLYVESEYDGVRTVADGEQNVIFKCDSETEASCSGYYNSDIVVICSDGEDCQKNCANNECIYQMMDATSALSLNLTCDGKSSCTFSTILCPTAHNATCTISCNDEWSCDWTVITFENANANFNKLQINCARRESDCNNMQVTVQAAEIKNIDINCHGSCWQMVFSVDADVVGDVDIVCTSFSSCSGSSWTSNVEYFERAQIECNGEPSIDMQLRMFSLNEKWSCESSFIGFSDAKSMTLYCNDMASDCKFVRIECPYIDVASCNIKWNSSFGGYLQIAVPEEYEYGYLNITGNGLNGDRNVTVECSPDHKNTQNTNLEYNESAAEYQCKDGTASYCCPFGVRYDYRAENHDPYESDFDYDLVDLDQYSPDSPNQTDHIIADESTGQIDQILNCDGEHCVIECSAILSCALSTIEIDGTNLSSVLVSCSDSFSCLSTFILVDSISIDVEVTVICSGEDSCNELTINITEFDSFIIYCVETSSCQELMINLDVEESENMNPTNYGVVHCVLPEVCNDMIINTNSKRTQLNMYEFSRGTVLNNGVGFLSEIPNIECNTNRWIQFDGLLETDSTVIQSVHNEYDDDSFPCEDVVVQCGNETVPKSCVMTYEYIRSDIVETLNNGSDLAFSVNMNDLYRITCNGECEESPTESPTRSPTHAPTSLEDYDYYAVALFEIDNLSKLKISGITRSMDSFVGNVSYFITAGFDNEYDIWGFEDFWVDISEINGIKVEKLKQKPDLLKVPKLKFKSIIKCTEIVCAYICSDGLTKKKPFQIFVESKINKHYGSNVSFSMKSIAGPMELYPDPEKVDYQFWVLLAICGMLFFMTALAFMFNKGWLPVIPPCTVVDNGKWTAVFSLAIQVSDFIGDIGFNVDIWTTWSELEELPEYLEDDRKSKWILASAIGSTTFLIIPYFVNLYTATKIKSKNSVVGRNCAAQIWFTLYSSIFIAFVILSGSTYTAMQMISSNVFGLKWLNCGLTQFELRKLFHLKVIDTVFLENVPQILFNCLYIDTMGGITEISVYSWFSLLTSVLSVLNTSLTYFIERDRGDNLLPIEYYLAIQCDRVNDCNLSPSEEEHIKMHCGRTSSLSDGISKIWGSKLQSGSQSHAFEIGKISVKQQGAVIHIIHYLNRSEFEEFAEENGDESDVTPLLYVRRQFAVYKLEITNLFQRHFELDSEVEDSCFNVVLLDPVQRKKQYPELNAEDNRNSQRNNDYESVNGSDDVSDNEDVAE